MRRLSFAAFILLVPFTAYLLTGCGGGNTKRQHTGGGDTGAEETGDETKTALKTEGTATIKGKVTYEGTPPKAHEIKALVEHRDCQNSPMAEKLDPTWRVGEDGGVQDVVVWVEPPAKKYFKLTDAQKTPKEKFVKLTQPHCEFIPHVLVMFPSYYDGKEMAPTGQKLEVVNDAKVPHNTKVTGDPRLNNIPNKQLAPDTKEILDVKAQDRPLSVNCDIHKFMQGRILALDTPFYAKTDKDGNFEIKGVPAGAEVRVKAWHEDLPHEGYLLPQSDPSASGEAVTLKDGETKTLNIKIRK